MDLDEAADRLAALREHLRDAAPRIGMIRDARPDVIEELDMVMAFVEPHRRTGARFNLALLS
ncbi:hypothetical protein [Jannaschia aquimarina]|uniref:hypothetical protein n=1 Tax=Jannaschia aquimarina TaxID=935700 RepID=UPI0013793648|nr:hypothetical protein [Jannaschia aquimarina]